MAKARTKRMAKAKLRDADTVSMEQERRRLRRLAAGQREIRRLARQIRAARNQANDELRQLALQIALDTGDEKIVAGLREPADISS